MKSPELLSLSSLTSAAKLLGLDVRELEAIASEAGKWYSPFVLSKAGKPRVIDCPIDPLREIQKRIYGRLLRRLSFPEHLFGGILGKSPKGNASVHLGQSVVIRIDIRSFFPSVRPRHVYTAWSRTLGCSPDIARILTKLTTWRGRLPQGASTSMPLANLVLWPADQKILELILGRDIRFSRFVDDLVFSGTDPRPIIQPVIEIVQEAGFSVSRRKTEITPSRRPQEVTGYLVNSKFGPTKSRGYRDRLRAAINELISLAAEPQAFQSATDSIRGRLAHLNTTNPVAAEKLSLELEKILEKTNQPGRVRKQKRRKSPKGTSLAKWREGLDQDLRVVDSPVSA